MHLPHHAQPVGGVAARMSGFMASAGLNCASGSLPRQAQHLDAMPQHVQRAALVEGIPQASQQRVGGVGAVVLDDGVPRFGLRRLHPRQHIVGEQCPRPVVCRRRFGEYSQPWAARCSQISVSKLISLCRLMRPPFRPTRRTSILPVTAAEIRRSGALAAGRWLVRLQR